MAHITFVHGMANKPPADRLGFLWLRALGRDDPRPDVFPSPNEGPDLDVKGISSEMVYWADVLYLAPDADESGYESTGTERSYEGVSRDKATAMGEDTPQLDAAGLPAAEARSMRSIESQLGLDREMGADEFPSDAERRKAEQGQYRLERIPLPWWLKERLMKILLRDVHHYLFNKESNPRGDRAYRVRDELRSRLLEALKRGAAKPPPHILVSHSMGTIISYDVLRNCGDCPPIHGFVTLGSPLGLDEVQDKLKPDGAVSVDFPAAKLRGDWVNVYDRLDPVVAFEPKFANDYQRDGHSAVRDINEQNWGDWRHSIHKYLSGTILRSELRRLLGI